MSVWIRSLRRIMLALVVISHAAIYEIEPACANDVVPVTTDGAFHLDLIGAVAGESRESVSGQSRADQPGSSEVTTDIFRQSADTSLSAKSDTKNLQALAPENDGDVAKAKIERVPLSDRLSPWFAILIGAIGSGTYLVAVWVGLIGPTEKGVSDLRLLDHFSKMWLIKVPSYVGSGGAVAMVFQLTEAKLIPVQAFIIGCTWPAVVANYLSARQAGEAHGVKEATVARQEIKSANELASRLSDLPPPKMPSESDKDELDKLLNKTAG